MSDISKLSKTDLEASDAGFTVNYYNAKLLSKGHDLPAAEKPFHPITSETPCIECKHMSYSIVSLTETKDGVPVMPSCQASLKDNLIPVGLDVENISKQACPDFVRR